jgi:GntR family transcriptional regulator, transcriptional repressor for pyruvate dehydrogenase complex
MAAPFSRDTLVDKVTNELRFIISDGQIQEGEYLPSRKELAARFGVGVSTVHEAVQALTAVGMLESHPGKGTWVREDAMETLVHPAAVATRLGELQARKICEARAVIEVALTELAAQRATEADTKKIQDAMTLLEASLDDDEAFVEADLSFHLAVAQAGRNELLEQFYHVSRKLLAGTIAELVRLPRVKEEGLVIQRSIAEAITAHDAPAARRAAEEHMQIVAGLLDAAEQSRGRAASS